MIEKMFFCSACGYSPTNRQAWCDLGCGRDYNQIYSVPTRFIEKLAADLKGALVAMVYVHPCQCPHPGVECARCRAVGVLGFDPAVIE